MAHMHDCVYEDRWIHLWLVGSEPCTQKQVKVGIGRVGVVDLYLYIQ